MPPSSEEARRGCAVMDSGRVLFVSYLVLYSFHSSTFGRADGRGSPWERRIQDLALSSEADYLSQCNSPEVDGNLPLFWDAPFFKIHTCR